MSEYAQSHAGRRPSDRYIPYYFVAFFVGLALLNVVFVSIAVRTQTGVVTENPYGKGVDYNSVVDANDAQARLGWQVKTSFDMDTGRFGVDLSDKNGSQIEGARVVVHFKRPTQAGFDFEQPLVLTSGRYSADVAFPLLGVWDAWVVVTRGDDMFQKRRRVEARTVAQ